MNKVYEAYTEVDEKWVKRIPAHWRMKRLKAIFAMRKEKNNPVITENILSLTAKQGVVPYAEKEGTGGNKPKSDMTQYNVAHENDLLVNCMNVVSGAAGVSRYFGAISPVYYALYPHYDDNVWYYHHIFRMMPFQRSLVGLGKGILMHESDEGTLTSVRMRISMDYLGNVMLPVPPRDEQDKIVAFLNWKVSDINKLISTKRKELNSLYALKKTVVNNAVTCGINGGEKRNSGIEWLGEISADFEIIPLKRLLKRNLQYGANESGIPYEDSLPRYIRITDITVDGKLKDEGKLSLTEEAANGFILEDGDILLARSGATVGKSFLYRKEYGRAGFAGYLIRAQVNMEKILPEFLYYYTLSTSYEEWKNQIFIQATIQNISAEKYANLTVPVPDLNCQKEIVEYLDNKCKDIDGLIDVLRSQIDILHELKHRFVLDVVTGKIDVRNEIIPEYEYIDEESDDVDLESEDEEV